MKKLTNYWIIQGGSKTEVTIYQKDDSSFIAKNESTGNTINLKKRYSSIYALNSNGAINSFSKSKINGNLAVACQNALVYQNI